MLFICKKVDVKKKKKKKGGGGDILKKKKKGSNIGSHNIRLRTFSIVYCFLCVKKKNKKKTLKENYIVGVSVNQEI